MDLHRVKLAALIAGTAIAASFSLAVTAQAATSATTTSHRSAIAAEGCSYDTANLGYDYYEADHARNLDWWARGSASSGNPVVLESVSSSSDLDCFHVEGGFGNSEEAFQLANSDLCLNISGDSTSVGAWVILYPCTFGSNELFVTDPSGLNDKSSALQSVSSGLCIDLGSGLNAGSILEQKTCEPGGTPDPFQAWYLTSSS